MGAAQAVNRWQKTPLDWAAEAPNGRTGPAGESHKLMAAAETDFAGQIARGKQQHHRVRADVARATCDKYVAHRIRPPP